MWEAGVGLAHFDGTTWTPEFQQSPPNINFAASSTDNEWASYYDSASKSFRIQRWDGSSWTPIPSPAQYVGEMATNSPTDTWAFGNQSTAIQSVSALGRPGLDRPEPLLDLPESPESRTDCHGCDPRDELDLNRWLQRTQPDATDVLLASC